MKLAIIGSRGIKNINLKEYITSDVDEIVSGGAKGVDTIAREFAKANDITFVEFLPEYEKYGRGAPLLRNKEIVNYADKIIAFWDGKSKGTKYVIEYAEKINKPCEVVLK
jgi:hypothetical protein